MIHMDAMRVEHRLAYRRGLVNSPFRRIRRLSAFIPGPKLRNRVRKMLSQQESEIAALEESGRVRAAAWIRICTWAHFFLTVLIGPVLALRDALFKKF